MEPSTGSDSDYFTSLAASSETVSVFSLPSNPRLGRGHPLNTFRTPFAPDRRKSSWYFHTNENIEPTVSSSSSLDFHISRTFGETSGDLRTPDALLHTSLVIVRPKKEAGSRKTITLEEDVLTFDQPLSTVIHQAKIVWSPPVGEKTASAQEIQCFPSPETVHLERIAQYEPTGEATAHFSASATALKTRNVVSYPWFYTSVYNRFFPLHLLKNGSSLVHTFSPHPDFSKTGGCTCDAYRILEQVAKISCKNNLTEGTTRCCNAHDYFKMIASVAYFTPAEREATEEGYYKTVGLPSVITDSHFVSKISGNVKGAPATGNVARVELCFPNEHIYAFGWKLLGEPHKEEVSYTLSTISAQDGKRKYLFRNAPESWLTTAHAGWHLPIAALQQAEWIVWTTTVGSPAPWPPPGIGLVTGSSHNSHSMMAGSFELEATNVSPGSVISLYALSCKVLIFSSVDKQPTFLI
jgi:hypothetical protein